MRPSLANKAAKEIQAHAVDLLRIHKSDMSQQEKAMAMIDRMTKVPIWYRKQVYDAFRYLLSPVAWLEQEEDNDEKIGT